MGTAALLQAVDLMLALNTFALRAIETQQRVAALISAAQREGRDLTEQELSALRADREKVFQEWQKIVGDQ